MLPLIDTHQHLWDLSRLELPWTGGIPQLNRSFLMSDYLQASEGQKVSKTVYMEVDVHPDHRQREVEIISEICSDESNPMQAAVFCAEPGGVDFEPSLRTTKITPGSVGFERFFITPISPREHVLNGNLSMESRNLGKSDGVSTSA